MDNTAQEYVKMYQQLYPDDQIPEGENEFYHVLKKLQGKIQEITLQSKIGKQPLGAYSNTPAEQQTQRRNPRMSLPYNASKRSDPISQPRQQGFWDDFLPRNPFSQDPRPALGPSKPRKPLQTNLFGSDQYVQDPVQPIQRKNQGRRQ